MLSGVGADVPEDTAVGSAFTMAAPAGIDATPEAALSTCTVCSNRYGTYLPVAASNVEQVNGTVQSPSSTGIRMQFTETPDAVSRVSGGYARKCSGSIFGILSISDCSPPVKLIFRLMGSPTR